MGQNTEVCLQKLYIQNMENPVFNTLFTINKNGFEFILIFSFPGLSLYTKFLEKYSFFNLLNDCHKIKIMRLKCNNILHQIYTIDMINRRNINVSCNIFKKIVS